MGKRKVSFTTSWTMPGRGCSQPATTTFSAVPGKPTSLSIQPRGRKPAPHTPFPLLVLFNLSQFAAGKKAKKVAGKG
jgi:hypothetical protein